MSRTRMKDESMTLERAENLVAHVIKERARWGKLYDGTSLDLNQVLDALVFLHENESQEVLDLRKSLATSNRQLGASKAREARLNKVNGELREAHDE